MKRHGEDAEGHEHERRGNGTRGKATDAADSVAAGATAAESRAVTHQKARENQDPERPWGIVDDERWRRETRDQPYARQPKQKRRAPSAVEFCRVRSGVVVERRNQAAKDAA